MRINQIYIKISHEVLRTRIVWRFCTARTAQRSSLRVPQHNPSFILTSKQSTSYQRLIPLTPKDSKDKLFLKNIVVQRMSEHKRCQNTNYLKYILKNTPIWYVHPVWELKQMNYNSHLMVAYLESKKEVKLKTVNEWDLRWSRPP